MGHNPTDDEKDKQPAKPQPTPVQPQPAKPSQDGTGKGDSA